MANLGKKGDVYVARFRFQGKEYKKSLKTTNLADAEAAMHADRADDPPPAHRDDSGAPERRPGRLHPQRRHAQAARRTPGERAFDRRA